MAYFIKDNKTSILTYDSVLSFIISIVEQVNCNNLDGYKLANNVYPKLKTLNTIEDIKEQIITCASEMIVDHYDYQKIAMWILISDLHKKTHDDFLKVTEQLYNNININGCHSPIISDLYYEFVKNNIDIINNALNYERDYEIALFGYRTLEKTYLKKTVDNIIIERPQHLYMRVAIAIHYRNNDINRILETYESISLGYFTHGTPTLFNAGTTREQLASCFLMGIDDNMESIGQCWKDCGLISKYSGGIGINVSNIRAQGAYINSTQGLASGMRFLTVIGQISRCSDQGGRRPGSISIHVEPWHADIFFVLDLKKNTGAETERARDLFLALIVNDLFMHRVEKDDVWSLMCPSECPNIVGKYGKEFDDAYIEYEKNGKYRKQIKARDLWFKIMDSQIETGMPYILYKDAINKKSNQINIGIVNGSNLCAEIVQVSNTKEYGVCSLVSVGLPKCVIIINGVVTFDYNQLYKIVRIVARNLNNIIDINFYPVKQAKFSNMKNRPIGIGVQGLADVFALFKTPFDSELAKDLNKKIFETIYFAALSESNLIAKENGYYEMYPGSPLSKGLFQFDLWGLDRKELSGMWDWDTLQEEIMKYGVSNSLVTACMPTASTSQIMNNNECIEPYTENIYTRTTMAGDYYVINKYLVADLLKLGLWNSNTIDMIKYYQGSIANIPFIPDEIKKLYRTVWEIPQKSIIDMAADRGPFIDQTQSMNIFIDKPNYVKLTSCLFHGWKRGLKTGIYYLRSKAGTTPNQFGIDINLIKEIETSCQITKICKYVPKHLRKQGECISCDG